MSFLRSSLLVALLGLLAAAPAAQAVEPGVVLNTFPDSDQVHQLVLDSGAKWIRTWLLPNVIETAPGTYDDGLLADYESRIAQYKAQGVKTELVVVGAPAASGDYRVPPSPKDYADFAAHVSKALPDVAAWEVWNEEDSAQWWHGPNGPDPAAYTALLKAAYPAFKSGTPHADVLVGGLTGNDYDFLEQLYQDGARGSFDGVSVHTDIACNTVSPYSYYRDPGTGRIGRWPFLGYQEVLKTMDQNGDSRLPLWFTEFGWSTTTAQCGQQPTPDAPGGVSEADQAKFASQALHCMALDPRVKGGFWFDLTDAGDADTAENRYGLLHTDLSPRPAFQAFADFTHHGDQLSGPCGDFHGPSIDVLELGDQGTSGTFTDDLHIKASASDPSDVAWIAVAIDGKHMRTYYPGAAPTLTATWDFLSAKHMTVGQHTVTLSAKDTQGNESSDTVTVTKLADSSGGSGSSGGGGQPGTPGQVPAQLGVQRVRISHKRLQVRGTMTPQADGDHVQVSFHAQGHWFSFRIEVRNGRLRAVKKLPKALRRSKSGWVTIRYQGGAVVGPGLAKVRTGRRTAHLKVGKTRLQGRHLKARGTISRRAHGSVELQLVWRDAQGNVRHWKREAKIHRRHHGSASWRLKAKVRKAARHARVLLITYPGRGSVGGEQAVELVQ